MSSGGGSSQTTEIKSKPSLLVQDWLSPEALQKFGQLANQYQERAFAARAANQDVTNRIMARYGEAPLFDPLVRSDTGATVQGNVVTPIDATQLIPSANFFKPPGADKENKRLRTEIKDLKSAQAYNDAVDFTKKSSYPSSLQN